VKKTDNGQGKAKDPKDRGIIHRKDKDGNIAWFARIVRVDGSGKPKQYTVKAESKSDARRKRKELESQHERTGERGIVGSRMTFRQLAAEYSKRLIPAEYHGDGDNARKVAGLRSYKTPQRFLQTLTNYFGAMQIRNIVHNDLEQFKRERLKQPIVRERKVKKDGKTLLVKDEKARAIASVNRELELMRAAMRFAQRQGWIVRSPFETGTPLISKADETRRERVLSPDEEQRLLDACGERTMIYTRCGKLTFARDKGAQRKHLRGLIVAALDTAMRRGELLALERRDVDLKNRLITVRAFNSKTATKRVVPITPRLKDELETLLKTLPDDSQARVFGITDTVKKSFASLCRAAGVGGFRFHDLRHTAITRMIAAGVPAPEVMKISGHTQVTTFLRYLNPTGESVRRAGELLSAFNTGQETKEELETVN
jgi:integrase